MLTVGGVCPRHRIGGSEARQCLQSSSQRFGVDVQARFFYSAPEELTQSRGWSHDRSALWIDLRVH